MKKIERAILNAVIVASITLFSNLLVAGYPPTMETVYTGIIGFCLAFMTQLRDVFGEKPPRLGMLV